MLLFGSRQSDIAKAQLNDMALLVSWDWIENARAHTGCRQFLHRRISIHANDANRILMQTWFRSGFTIGVMTLGLENVVIQIRCVRPPFSSRV